MPTYNFKTGGDIEIDGVTRLTIEGPAIAVPNLNAYTFTLRYLDGNDLYYYDDTNVFKIDGDVFEGTLSEFCTAASALYESAGGGGSAWSNIEADTAVVISEDHSLSFASEGERPVLDLLTTSAGNNRIIVGDRVTSEGYTSHAIVTYSATSSESKLLATPDGEDTYAAVSVSSASGGTSVLLEFAGGAAYNTIGLDSVGIAVGGVVEYADNAAALTGGLTAGYLYRTGDALKIVH